MAPADRAILQNSWLIPVARKTAALEGKTLVAGNCCYRVEMRNAATAKIKKQSATDPASKEQGDATIALPVIA